METYKRGTHLRLTYKDLSLVLKFKDLPNDGVHSFQKHMCRYTTTYLYIHI